LEGEREERTKTLWTFLLSARMWKLGWLKDLRPGDLDLTGMMTFAIKP